MSIYIRLLNTICLAGFADIIEMVFLSGYRQDKRKDRNQNKLKEFP
jgi:hypothetical protein